MNAHLGIEEMNDLVDGLVPAADEGSLRAHLRACPHCRRDFEALEATVRALRDAPDAARAPEAIWKAIEARIAAGEDGSEERQVLALPTSRRGPRRFSLTIPQLAAAAVVVSLLSAAVVWKAMSGGPAAGPGPAAVATAAEPGPSARVVASGQAGYEEAVAQLQTILDEGRDVLSPETLTTLEASLRTIDDAIAEVRTALESDPSSELLARLLANHQRSKLRVLRQAAISVQPRS